MAKEERPGKEKKEEELWRKIPAFKWHFAPDGRVIIDGKRNERREP